MLIDYIVTTQRTPMRSSWVIFGEYPDYKLNPPEARGVGEIGLAGAAAVIISPTSRVTGKRIRELPVKVEDRH